MGIGKWERKWKLAREMGNAREMEISERNGNLIGKGK
jgi:hypothetical protein